MPRLQQTFTQPLWASRSQEPYLIADLRGFFHILRTEASIPRKSLPLAFFERLPSHRSHFAPLPIFSHLPVCSDEFFPSRDSAPPSASPFRQKHLSHLVNRGFFGMLSPSTGPSHFSRPFPPVFSCPTEFPVGYVGSVSMRGQS